MNLTKTITMIIAIITITTITAIAASAEMDNSRTTPTKTFFGWTCGPNTEGCQTDYTPPPAIDQTVTVKTIKTEKRSLCIAMNEKRITSSAGHCRKPWTRMDSQDYTNRPSRLHAYAIGKETGIAWQPGKTMPTNTVSLRTVPMTPEEYKDSLGRQAYLN